MAQYFHPIARQKQKYFRLKLQVNRIDLNTVSRSFPQWCLSMYNKEALFKSSWGLFMVCARLTFSLLGYKIRNVSPSFKSRNVNHWYCHLCTSSLPFWWIRRLLNRCLTFISSKFTYQINVKNISSSLAFLFFTTSDIFHVNSNIVSRRQLHSNRHINIAKKAPMQPSFWKESLLTSW